MSWNGVTLIEERTKITPVKAEEKIIYMKKRSLKQRKDCICRVKDHTLFQEKWVWGSQVSGLSSVSYCYFQDNNSSGIQGEKQTTHKERCEQNRPSSDVVPATFNAMTQRSHVCKLCRRTPGECTLLSHCHSNIGARGRYFQIWKTSRTKALLSPSCGKKYHAIKSSQ